MILVERGPASSHVPAEPARAGEPAPDVLEFPSARRLGWSLKVHYRNDERSRFRRLPGGWLYVASPTGLECFPDLAAIIDNAHFTGLPAALDALEHMRPAAFVAYDEQTEELQFGRSLDGFASLYFGGELPAIVIGESNFVVARRLGPIRFSKADEEAYCKNWSPGPEGSFLEGVTRCFAGVRYLLDVERDAPDRCFAACEYESVAQGLLIHRMREEMLRICATYKTKRLALQLSSGVDSRFVLAALLDGVNQGVLTREQIVCVSVMFSGHDWDESNEARQIANFSGFEWVGVEADEKRAQSALLKSLTAHSPPFPTNFMPLLCMNIAKKVGAQILLSGHGGDEIFCFDSIDVLGHSWMTRFRNLSVLRNLSSSLAPVAYAKAIVGAWLGRRSLFDTRRMLRQLQVPVESIYLHRLGRRLGVASGIGYEALATSAEDFRLFVDAPLFRSSIASFVDPALCQHPSGDNYKAPAFLYMDSVAPGLVEVRTRKVTFGAMMRQRFGGVLFECDAVDGQGAARYGSTAMYRAWRSQF
ncbi:asparagine synthase-related protein [Dokdonella sp.]|uniref:asparagine synthase-related protein n=1 Tax=Dokdonella sp. TaxID=2291710 RepID=UPI0031CBC0EC|nr:asparagine synthase-related protein [Dokdonella sp.]